MRAARTLILLLAVAVLAGCAALKVSVAYSRERDLMSGRWRDEKISAAVTLEPKKASLP